MSVRLTKQQQRPTSAAAAGTTITATTTATAGPFPGPRTRVRTGCLTCRKRKVKCDEHRPHCWNCERLSRVCRFDQAQPPSIATRSTSGSETGLEYGDNTAVSQSSGEPVAEPANGLIFNNTPNTTARQLHGSFNFAALPNVYDMTDLDTPMPLQGSGGVVDDFVLFSPFNPINSPIIPGFSDADSMNFTYFQNHVQPPFITPFDTPNWNRFKRIAVDLARQYTIVAAAISCVQALYEAEINLQDTSKAMSLYHVAKAQFAGLLEQDRPDLEVTLIATFLLCCFEIVAQQETVSITMKADGPFVKLLEQWTLLRPWPPIAARIEAWLKILNTKAFHLGGKGLLSGKVYQVLNRRARDTLVGPTPSLLYLDPDPAPFEVLFDAMHGQLWEFYLSLHDLMMGMCGLNRHHRSRGSPRDEVEVDQMAVQVRRNLYNVYQQRPSLLQLSEEELRSLLGAQDETVLRQLSNLIDLLNAAYYVELVDLGRSHGQGSWQNPMPEAAEGMKQVRSIVDANVAKMNGQVDSGFMWAIFFYALEADDEGGEWAVRKLRQIKSPVCRSDYAADLLAAVLDEQRSKQDRVDCRYCAFERFGVPPPFI